MHNKNIFENLPNHFPQQHQDIHPGLEYLMKPLPIFDNPCFIGTGKLKNKVAIITGGDSGIGKAVATIFAKEGADIVIVYYNEHIDATNTKNYIEKLGRKCLLICGDIKDEKFCKKVIDITINYFKHLDILVNNAGVAFPQNSIEEVSCEQLYETFGVNIFSYFFMVKYSLPYLKKGDTIICTTSSTAYSNNSFAIDYSASKAAVVSFIRSLAPALIQRGIRINGVAPGATWTPLITTSVPIDEISTFGNISPIGRIAQPFEIAPAYLYLASNDSSYVVGQVIHVDGGITLS